jgi:ammonium transporter, Amt family
MFTDSIIEAFRTGETSYDLTCAMNGALAGLAAITAGCATVEPWAAIVIGAVAGWAYLALSKLLVALKIDDAVDAVPVHLAGGLWGVFAAGLFSNATLMNLAGYNGEKPGLIYGNGGDLMLVQLTAMAWIIGWVSCTMIPFFVVLNIAGMFRVDSLEEDVGLDISHHRGAGYDLKEAPHNAVEELMEERASKHGKVEVPREVAKAADYADSAVVEEEEA